MANTYEDNAPIDEKAAEELRLIRSLLERLLRCLNESNFVDYQLEKFSGRFNSMYPLQGEIGRGNRGKWEKKGCGNCGCHQQEGYEEGCGELHNKEKKMTKTQEKLTTKDSSGNEIPICKECGKGISMWLKNNESHYNGWGTLILHNKEEKKCEKCGGDGKHCLDATFG